MTKLEVLYEDNHLLIVKKPPNIPSQEDSSHDLDMLNLAKQYIKQKYNKPGNVYVGLIQRLDRPVSGIMIFAKTSKASKRLSEQIKKHEIKKEYLAVVRGIIKETEGTFIDYLEKTANFNTIVSTKEKGKYAELDYIVLEKNYNKKETLVKISLKTGRHHQIRVQFASRNYPLCGDQRYGKKDGTMIALESHHLVFFHPITKEKMSFSLPYPQGTYWDDFSKK